MLTQPTLLLLDDALAHPNQVSDLLFLETNVRVEAGVVELSLKGEFVQSDLSRVEEIVDGQRDVVLGGLLGLVRRQDVGKRLEGRERLNELLLVLHVAQSFGTVRVQRSDGGIQGSSIGLSDVRLVERGTE